MLESCTWKNIEYLSWSWLLVLASQHISCRYLDTTPWLATSSLPRENLGDLPRPAWCDALVSISICTTKHTPLRRRWKWGRIWEHSLGTLMMMTIGFLVCWCPRVCHRMEGHFPSHLSSCTKYYNLSTVWGNQNAHICRAQGSNRAVFSVSSYNRLSGNHFQLPGVRWSGVQNINIVPGALLGAIKIPTCQPTDVDWSSYGVGATEQNREDAVFLCPSAFRLNHNSAHSKWKRRADAILTSIASSQWLVRVFPLHPAAEVTQANKW